jgi:hypothetical protein
MAGTSPAMTREKWFNVTGIRSKGCDYLCKVNGHHARTSLQTSLVLCETCNAQLIPQ